MDRADAQTARNRAAQKLQRQEAAIAATKAELELWDKELAKKPEKG